MSEARKFLCLFSSAELMAESCFRDGKGWQESTDAGRVEFVPHVLDEDFPALAISGLFAASTLLVRSADLANGRETAFLRGVSDFQGSGSSTEIVASENPIALVEWLMARAPELVSSYRQDGEVRYGYPSWWRTRAERHLSGTVAEGGLLETDASFDPAELKAFVAKRRGL